ncbi:MAG TPA: hypothetical protein VF838_19940 [Trebonia sp.]
MNDPDDATLAAYQSRVQEYLRGTPGPVPELTAFLDRFATLAGSGPVLEIGSGPGRDAASPRFPVKASTAGIGRLSP